MSKITYQRVYWIGGLIAFILDLTFYPTTLLNPITVCFLVFLLVLHISYRNAHLK